MVQVAENKHPGFTTESGGFQFSVSISADLMMAYLQIDPVSKESAFTMTVEDLIGILKQAGVVHGIKNDQLAKQVTSLVVGKRIEVARGTSPQKGEDAKFDLLFEANVSKAPVVGADGYIDYKNLNIIRNAVIGQPLAKKIPPKKGEPGITVTGEEVQGLPGKDRALPKGKNTDVSPNDPDLLVATETGAINYGNSIVTVEKIYKILKDVDTSTGNINYVGNLQIGGNVKAGFKVVSEGNIEIGKNIEDAEIISGGSIVATGGFVSSGNGLVQAKEDVFIKFIENGRVEAGNDINVGGQVMNGVIEAGNAIYLKGKKAVILGGQATAYNLIETDSIGSNLGTKTLARVGYSPTLMREYQRVDNEIKRMKTDQERVKQALYSLVRLEMDHKLNEIQKESIGKLKSCRDEMPGQIEFLENQKQELLKKLDENKNAKIIVKGTAYHGSVIQIGMLKKELINDVSHCTFRIERDQIVTATHY